MVNWQDRSVLVTGGSGFLGGWLIKYLIAQQADVVCIMRDWIPDSELIRNKLTDKVKVVRGDITDQSLDERVLGEYEVNTVFHLAAQAIVGVANRNPVSTFESDIKGTWSILEACRRSPKVKCIVVASSDKSYVEDAPLPFKETTPLAGAYPYDVSKSCVDLISQSYTKTYNMPIGITRCGNFYGGGDLNWNRIVPGTIRSIIRGNPPIIRSNGKSIRDYFYVEDGVLAYIKLAEKLLLDKDVYSQAFNFANEKPVTVIEIVNKILELMQSKLVPNILNESNNEIIAQYLDATKAHNVLKWQPEFDLETGLTKTIKWYREYFNGKR